MMDGGAVWYGWECISKGRFARFGTATGLADGNYGEECFYTIKISAPAAIIPEIFRFGKLHLGYF